MSEKTAGAATPGAGCRRPNTWVRPNMERAWPPERVGANSGALRRPTCWAAGEAAELRYEPCLTVEAAIRCRWWNQRSAFPGATIGSVSTALERVST